ncbi:MAG: hypothetical protein V4719_13605 [Planctomycetota bacterium]
MSSLLRNCGAAALVLSAACLSLSQAEAGGRRSACNCQQYYAAPAATTYVAPAPAPVAATDGRQRYQSAYQAPATNMPAPAVYAAPADNYYYYGSNQPLRFQDRTFHDQWDAGRKIRGL